MESFKKLSNRIFKTHIGSKEYKGKYYLFLTNPIDEEFFLGGLNELINEASIDLMEVDVENATRQISRLQRHLDALHKYFNHEDFKDSNDDLFEQIRMTASLRGLQLTYDDRDAFWSDKYEVSNNFIWQLRDDIGTKGIIIKHLESYILEQEPVEYSIFTEETMGPVLTGIPHSGDEREVPDEEWDEIIGNAISSTLIRNQRARSFKQIEGIFLNKYRKRASEFFEVLKVSDQSDLRPLINENYEWIGKPAKLAYIFYDCLLHETIVEEVKNLKMLSALFISKFTKLSSTFATTGREPSNFNESEYKKYFLEKIRLLKAS